MYGFYFDRDGETIRLPINTGKLTEKSGGKNKTVDLIATGEFNILKNPGLREYSFKILLPGIPYPFVHTKGDFHPPSFYLEKFRDYRDSKRPVRFIVTRGNDVVSDVLDDILKDSLNTLVSFEDVTVEESAGEEGDFYVDLRLKEYREITIVTPVIDHVEPDGTPVAEEITERPAKTPPREYTVIKGDCLWAIAKRLLGDGSRYKEIAALNSIKNPNLIYPGQVFILPA